MFREAILFSLLAVVLCQYQQRRAPPPEYDTEPDYDDYQPRSQPTRSQPPPPPPPPRHRVSPNSVRLREADVHYVNIGAELAGDYKFGYDTGKGDDGQSFREETRLPDGTVQGAYGYVDETGTQRIVKYTAGKEGFKILKDNEGTPSRTNSQPAPAYKPPPQPARAPPAAAYAPQPQPARAPVPAPYVPPPQAVRVPTRSHVPVQQPPRAPAQSYAPQPQPAYRAPPQQAYRPAPQRSYAPETQTRSRSREYAPEPPKRRPQPVEEPDYDYPDNEIQERRLVPIDTSLFNYNIGTNRN